MTEDFRDPFVVSPSIRAVEDAIVDTLEKTDVFAEVSRGLTINPKAAPSANVALEFFSKGDEETGHVVNYGWRWTILLAFDYTANDAYDVYFAALIIVVRAFQKNYNLNESCYRHDLRDLGRAVPHPGRGQLTKALEVVAELEEEDDFGF